MKRTPILLAAALALLCNTGCTTLTEGERETLLDAADGIKTTVDGLVTLAIANDKDNRAIVILSTEALDQLILAGTFDPSKVEEAIVPIWNKIKDPNVAFGLRTGLTAYRILVRKWIKGAVDGNEVARTLLAAFRDGAKQALQQSLASRMQRR